jgi:multisubunit Na+/H+ antiporter MnhE subunit
MGIHVPLSDLALWTGAAFALWLVLTAALDRLGAPVPAVVGALVAWLLARLLMSGVPELIRWAADALSMMS